MSNSQNRWNIRTVPQSFWDRIEGAGRDTNTFKESLMELSESDLRELVAQFNGLGQELTTSGFQQFPEEVQEESAETLKEIANWVITQGRAYYEDLLAHPEKFPKRRDIRRPIFAGAVIEVYTRKFGPWRSDD